MDLSQLPNQKPFAGARADRQANCPQSFNPKDGEQARAMLRDHLEVVQRSNLMIMFEPASPLDPYDTRQVVLLGILPSGEIVLSLLAPACAITVSPGAPMILSKVVWREGNPCRLGIAASLVDIKKVLLAADSEERSTILIGRLASSPRLLLTDAREGVRVDLDRQSRVSFSSKSCVLTPQNISLGGVGFTCPKGALAVGQKLRLDLALPDKVIFNEVELVRQQEFSRRLVYMGAKFLHQEGAGGLPKARFKAHLHLAIAAEQARQIRQLKKCYAQL